MARVELITTEDCTRCEQAKDMLRKLRIKYIAIDATKQPEILAKYPIMAAPGIAINGKLVFSGLPSESELKKRLKM